MKNFYLFIVLACLIGTLIMPALSFSEETTLSFSDLYNNEKLAGKILLAEMDRRAAKDGYKYRIEYIDNVRYYNPSGSFDDQFEILFYTKEYSENKEKKELILMQHIIISDGYIYEEKESGIYQYGVWGEEIVIPDERNILDTLVRVSVHFARHRITIINDNDK
ncbi:MAG: hypothetical protein AAB851_01085 [Patescibacteria group bacterium]